MQKIFIVCPTYRLGNDSALRFFGLVSIIEQIKKQKVNCDIKICIVDSSDLSHPFFRNWKHEDFLLYFHIPNRNNIDKKILQNFQYASSFIPSDSGMNSARWQKITQMAIAWNNFLPWDKNYPVKSTFKQQIMASRPTIGMKRNFAIAALKEKFGDADYICCFDDDDFRSDNYVANIVNNIRENDFVRVLKFVTFVVKTQQCGFYNIDFTKDVNGNYMPSEKDLHLVMHNSLNSNDTKYTNYTVEERFPRLLSLAFPHISCDGGLQAFRFDLWERAVNAFGGIPPVSLGEDILFYRNCKSYFGNDFKSDFIDVSDISFLRVQDINYTSVAEWTHPLTEDDMPIWAKYYINKFNAIKNQDPERLYTSVYEKFKSSHSIQW